MRKLLSIAFVASLLLIGTKASAQISLGAGYTNTAQKVEAASLNKTVVMNGLYVGFDYNVPVTENIGIAPGIYYNFSTGLANNLINLPKLGGLLKGRLDEHYIDIPVHFNFSIPFQGNRAFIYAGPTISCGVSSKIKADASILGLNIKGDVLNLYENKFFERFDVLLGGGIGADISDIVRITVGYNWGAFNRIGASDLSESGDGSISSNLGKLIKDNAKISRSMAHIGVAVLF